MALTTSSAEAKGTNDIEICCMTLKSLYCIFFSMIFINVALFVLLIIHPTNSYHFYCFCRLVFFATLIINILSFMYPSEFGRNAQIISYTGNRVAIRKVDGAILFAATSSDIGLLYELTRAGRWEESLR